MTKLTQIRVSSFDWAIKKKQLFNCLKQKLCSCSNLALPEGKRRFIGILRLLQLRRVWALNENHKGSVLVMTIGLDLPKQILRAQTEATKAMRNQEGGGKGGLLEGVGYNVYGDLRTVIMLRVPHKSKILYSSGSSVRLSKDMKKLYWVAQYGKLTSATYVSKLFGHCA
ncbi:hypothetical protein Tco_1408104 [Tanacetum coccineum]